VLEAGLLGTEVSPGLQHFPCTAIAIPEQVARVPGFFSRLNNEGRSPLPQALPSKLFCLKTLGLVWTLWHSNCVIETSARD